MSKPVSVTESEFPQGRPAPGGICSVCNEHMLEAKLIQSSLLPPQGLRHGCVDIAFRFIPFSNVGGDFADFFRLPDGLIGISLVDVVGKGLPAAMYGVLVMGILRGIHKTGTDTAKVLVKLNELLLQRGIKGRFCSTLYALFNPATRELIFSNAGMPLPLLVSGSECRKLGDGGLPSGMFSGSTYGRHVVELAPGDCVLIATDGLHELRNSEKAQCFGAELEEVWVGSRHKSATELLDIIFDRQRAFSACNPPHDDITAVVLKLLP